MKNHEKMQQISERVREGLDTLEVSGVPYYDERASQLVAVAVRDCMPELAQWQHERVRLAALQGTVCGNDALARFDELEVGGRLGRISVQKQISSFEFEGTTIKMASHDLCAVLVPDFFDADPAEVAFGRELYVPFGGMLDFNVLPQRR